MWWCCELLMVPALLWMLNYILLLTPHCYAGSTTGPNYYVRVLSTIDRELLKPNSSVALHKHSNALVDVLPPEADSSIAMLTAEEKPDVSYADIGMVILLLWFVHD